LVSANSRLNVINSAISGCSGINGGAIFAEEQTTVAIYGSVFVGNVAINGGTF
jgi:hypothetical protein